MPKTCVASDDHDRYCPTCGMRRLPAVASPQWVSEPSVTTTFGNDTVTVSYLPTT